MEETSDRNKRFDRLRGEAERILASLGRGGAHDESDRVLHLMSELDVHQIELEVQNEELQRAYDELSSLQKQYEDLYEFAPGGYVTLNAKGFIKQINLSGVTILGLERKRLQGMMFQSSIDPRYQASYVTALQKANLNADKQSIQIRLKNTANNITWIGLSIEAVHTEQGELIEYRLMFLDISSQKHAEEQLYEREKQLEIANKRLQIAIDGGNMGIWDRDFNDNSMVWNEKLYELLGLSPDTPVTADTFFEYMHPEDIPGIKKRLQVAIETGEMFEAEFRAIRADGIERWMFSSGKLIRSLRGIPIRMSGITLDITDRKLVDAELEKNRSLLNSIIDNTPALVYVNDLKGRAILVNQAVENLLDMPREKIIGKTAFDIYSKEAAEQNMLNDHIIIETGAPSTFEEKVMIRNKMHTFFDIKFPLNDSSGNIYGIGGIASDITGLKRIEDELKHHEKQLSKQFHELNAIYEGAPVGLCVFDRDLRYVRINYWLANMDGLSPEEHIGKTVDEVSPQLAKTILILSERMKNTRQPIHEYDLTHISADDTEQEHYWLSNWIPQFDKSGDIEYIYLAVQDITETIHIRKNLERSTLLLTHSLNQFPGMFSIWDRESRLVYANRTWMDFHSGRKRKLVGNTFRNIYRDKDQNTIITEIERTYETGEAQETTTKHNHAGIEAIYLRRFVPVKDDNGDVDVVLDVGQEITRFEKRRESLESIHDQLEGMIVDRTEKLRLSAEDLQNTNVAFTRLVDEYTHREEASQQRIIEQLNSLVIPHLMNLEHYLSGSEGKRYVQIIQENINEISLQYGRTLETIKAKLSPTEFQVAHLIRNNYTTDQIAEILHIEQNTVFTHRRNIRKKLGMKKKDVNLQTYLMSVT